MLVKAGVSGVQVENRPSDTFVGQKVVYIYRIAHQKRRNAALTFSGQAYATFRMITPMGIGGGRMYVDPKRRKPPLDLAKQPEQRRDRSSAARYSSKADQKYRAFQK